MSVHGGNSTDSNHNGQKLGNPRYRTKLCRNYPLGSCRFGDHCSYLHIVSTPSPATQLAPPMHSIVRSIIYPSISPMPGLSPSYHPPDAHPRALGGSRGSQTTQNGRAGPRVARPDASKRSTALGRASATAAGLGLSLGSGTVVEKWRLAVSADSALPPVPPGTPVMPAWGAGDVGGCAGLIAPVHGHPQLHQRAHLTSSTRDEGPTAKPIRHRNQFFKTKFCRFYREPAGCIKGDRCNFVHESPDEGRRPSGLVLAASVEVASEAEVESGAESSVQGGSPSTPAASDQAHSVSDHSDQEKKNYYPVTWRVVGGGVMMSGKREVCESFMAGHCPEGADCRYAHPNTTEEQYTAPYVEPPSDYSVISSILSPVIYTYPVVYPTLSPTQTFALSGIPAPGPRSPPLVQLLPTSNSQNSKNGHGVRPNLSIAPIIAVQPSGLPYPYSPHRVVDGSTLVECEQASQYPAESQIQLPGEGQLCASGGRYLSAAARSVVRPVSTPPTPMAVSDAGIARLFAAEMP